VTRSVHRHAAGRTPAPADLPQATEQPCSEEVWAFFVTDFPATESSPQVVWPLSSSRIYCSCLWRPPVWRFRFSGVTFGGDLDDFLRVFLGIRLPFVAFGGVFRESREPNEAIKAGFFGWANRRPRGMLDSQFIEFTTFSAAARTTIKR
jgi:hypothetical protein